MITNKGSRRSKIVCTLGPASSTTEMIKALAGRGMDVCRINFAYGTVGENEALFKRVRESDPALALMCDIQGPKIRIGEVGTGEAALETGQDFILTADAVTGDSNRVTVSRKALPGEVKPGDRIYLSDGLVALVVLEVAGDDIRCKVTMGGIISSMKGVNLPGIDLAERVPTEKDAADLQVIAALDPEYAAISFVKDASDMIRTRDILADAGNGRIKLVAKIEHPAALKNFDAILEASDAIIVGRGSLGVEVPFEKLIPEQKRIIKKSNRAGKPVIVATQMLESMVTAPVPTRAEVSDVFNAIEDGADAVMLSSETSSGKYPLNAVEAMSRIIQVSGEYIPPRNPYEYDTRPIEKTEIIGHLVYDACRELSQSGAPGSPAEQASQPAREVKILTFTHTGLTARMVSKYRPPLPIVAFTPEQRTARELRLVWGVHAVLVPGSDPGEIMSRRLVAAVKALADGGGVGEGDTFIITGNLDYALAKTNLVSIFTAREVFDMMEGAGQDA
ncbi:MAG: pyruvate kinase [Candidatus Lokiarchaeota archaeon]|nr:pyruvate kinase [Candidatus Lokiarchaeota archaeon]